MNAPGCERMTFADLTDYTAGERSDTEARALEEHLFSCASCAARAAELDALARAIPPAIQTAEVGGFVTDAVLNRLAREGVRVRTFALAPGVTVPCAVWDGDELMALRLRGDFRGAKELTLSQRVAGTEVSRATAQISASAHDEVIYAEPADWIRQRPVAECEIRLTTHEGGEERLIGSYTLVHGGALHR